MTTDKIHSIMTHPASQWNHPRVKLNLRNRTISLQTRPKGYWYEIDLDRWTHPAEILDTILQVAAKPWCDGELLKQFLEAIEHAAESLFDNNAQGVFCPCGANMRIDWVRRTYARA